jgi:hypothetical protein
MERKKYIKKKNVFSNYYILYINIYYIYNISTIGVEASTSPFQGVGSGSSPEWCTFFNFFFFLIFRELKLTKKKKN